MNAPTSPLASLRQCDAFMSQLDIVDKENSHPFESSVDAPAEYALAKPVHGSAQRTPPSGHRLALSSPSLLQVSSSNVRRKRIGPSSLLSIPSPRRPLRIHKIIDPVRSNDTRDASQADFKNRHNGDTGGSLEGEKPTSHPSVRLDPVLRAPATESVHHSLSLSNSARPVLRVVTEGLSNGSLDAAIGSGPITPRQIHGDRLHAEMDYESSDSWSDDGEFYYRQQRKANRPQGPAKQSQQTPLKTEHRSETHGQVVSLQSGTGDSCVRRWLEGNGPYVDAVVDGQPGPLHFEESATVTEADAQMSLEESIQPSFDAVNDAYGEDKPQISSPESYRPLSPALEQRESVTGGYGGHAQTCTQPPRWQQPGSRMAQAVSTNDRTRAKSSRVKSYYRGSVSVQLVPGESGGFSPVMVLHSSSSSANTTRHPSHSSHLGETNHASSGSNAMGTIPEPYDRPDASVFTLPDKKRSQGAEVAEEGGVPIDIEMASSYAVHSPDYSAVTGLSPTASPDRSVSVEPTVSRSPMSPQFLDSPKSRRHYWPVLCNDPKDIRQHLDEICTPLLGDDDFLFRHEKLGRPPAPTAAPPSTPKAEADSASTNDADIEDEGAMTPLSPNVEVFRRHKRTRKHVRDNRADSGHDGTASDMRKRCASYHDDKGLEEMGASPGKKRSSKNS